MEIVEINGKKFVKIGKWLFDAYLCDDGENTLGITVYEPGTDPLSENGKCLDLFVGKDLKFDGA